MNETTYSNAKVEFVSGHSGTSVIEIIWVLSSAPIGLLLRNVSVKNLKISHWLKFLCDFLCLVIPLLLCFTLLSEELAPTLIAIVLLSATSLFVKVITNASTHKQLKQNKNNLNSFSDKAIAAKRPFISAFRANVNLATAISILAVDFVIFPRRFCKAETYGTGLMDVGVGLFVISNALVSPEARGKYPDSRSLMSKLKIIVNSIKSSSPLWFLGALRLVLVKGTDYHEHVSEYGVHWNFFFTLAVIRVFSSVVMCVFHPNLSLLLAICIGFGYQYILDGPLKLKHFVLHGQYGDGSRDGLINANREGLVSCLGYLAIYFAGVHMGKHLLKPRKRLGEWIKTLGILIVIDIILWFCLYYAENTMEPVSRRLANFPYVLWTVAYSLLLLVSFLLVDIIDEIIDVMYPKSSDKTDKQEFCLLEAINYNGLLYFLLANVFTGTVNFTVSTLYTPTWTAFVILLFYTFMLSITISYMYVQKICFKFW